MTSSVRVDSSRRLINARTETSDVEPLDVIGDHNDRLIASDFDDQVESGRATKNPSGAGPDRMRARQQGGTFGGSGRLPADTRRGCNSC